MIVSPFIFGSSAAAISAALEGDGPGTGIFTWRLWRISAQDAVDAGGLELREIEFNIGGVDQTGAGVPAASDEFSSGTSAGNAFDDSTATSWASAFDNVWPKWVQYDFGVGNDKAVDEVTIIPQSASRSPSDFDVECSVDGVVWFNAGSFSTVQADWTAGVEKAFAVESPEAPLPLTIDAYPVIESVTSVKQDTDQPSITFNKPAGLADNDLLVVVAAAGDNATDISAPDGSWTRHQIGHYGAALGAVFTKLVSDAAGEAASYAFSLNLSRKAAGAIYRISGCDPADPVSASAITGSGSNSTAHTAPSLHAPQTGSLLLCFAIGGWGGNFTHTTPANMTDDFEESHASGGSNGLVISGAHLERDVGGPTLRRTFTCSAGLHYAAISLAIAGD